MRWEENQGEVGWQWCQSIFRREWSAMLFAAERSSKMRMESGPWIWQCGVIGDLEWFQRPNGVLNGIGSREEQS